MTLQLRCHAVAGDSYLTCIAHLQGLLFQIEFRVWNAEVASKVIVF